MVDKTTYNKLGIIRLYLSNYLGQHHVREIARLTKKSHVTLLPHLNDLEKGKILSAKKMGKNKVYSLNLDNILAKNYLIISELVEAINCLEQNFIIKKIAAEISKAGLTGAVILFGSYAKRTFKADSDIDIFYLGSIKEPDILKIKGIGRTYGKTISIKISTLNNFEQGLRKKDALAMEIVKYHLILNNPDLFINILWRHYYGIREQRP